MCRFNEAAAIRCGSQRAECLHVAGDQASMRPQRFAADHDTGEAQHRAQFTLASMRPQRFAADHAQGKTEVGDGVTRFNEAAAIRCGSPDLKVTNERGEYELQ